jgi:phosphatidylserine decarboxylase
MRIPLTRYGWPEVVIFPAATAVAMTICPLLLVVVQWRSFFLMEAVLGIILVWILSFFRDPDRQIQAGSNLLLAPADGKVTDIEEIEEKKFIGGKALRVGIFLSIFDAHINRAPCNVRVEQITYRPGKYKNARSRQAGQVNESNDLGLFRTDSPNDRLIVRQISGAIARRIVCEARQGQELACGEKFGMIKFGSRTELYVPMREDVKCMVKKGDKVKAGVTIIVRYE